MPKSIQFELPAGVDRRTVAFANGGVVFIRGDRGDFAYFVKSGKVEIREGGRVLEVMAEGEIFGEMALIDAEPRSASAVAVDRAELVVIDKATFLSLVRNDPEFALNIMRLMARRLRAMLVAHRAVEASPMAPFKASA